MELLEVKHLNEIIKTLKGEMKIVKAQVKELKSAYYSESERRFDLDEEYRKLLYRLVEVKEKERDPLVVTKPEAQRLLGSVSTFKIDTMVRRDILHPVQLGGEGRKMFRLSELMDLITV